MNMQPLLLLPFLSLKHPPPIQTTPIFGIIPLSSGLTVEAPGTGNAVVPLKGEAARHFFFFRHTNASCSSDDGDNDEDDFEHVTLVGQRDRPTGSI